MTEADSQQAKSRASEQAVAVNKAVDLNWKEEIRRTAAFVRDHWALLGGGVLVLSVIAMNNYLSEEGIPLSITSPSVIAGLPALFILIAFAVVTLAGAAALPTAILLSKGSDLKRSLMDEFQWQSDRRLRLRLTLYWSSSLVITALAITLLLHWPWLAHLVGSLGIFAIVVLLFFVSQIIVIAAVLPWAWQEHFHKKWALFAICSLLQALIMINLGAIVESQAPGGLGWMLMLLSVSMLVLSLFQVASAWIVWEVARKPKLLIDAGGMAALIMLAICTMPTLNRFFVGYVLASSAMGGRSCVVLEWAKGAHVLPELRRDKDEAHSIDLRIPMSTQNTFYAKPTMDKKAADGTLLIPVRAVAKVSQCERKNTAAVTDRESG